MSKELEALHTIAFNTQFIAGMNFGNELRTIENALQRLESIDNSKPSEAMKELKLVENWVRDTELAISKVTKPSLNINKQALVIESSLNTIKQTLLKIQEQDDKVKAFDLINEKRVDIKLILKLFPSLILILLFP